MPGALEEDVSPVSLLMYDTSEIASIIVPSGRGLAAESLDAAEGRILPK